MYNLLQPLQFTSISNPPLPLSPLPPRCILNNSLAPTYGTTSTKYPKKLNRDYINCKDSNDLCYFSSVDGNASTPDAVPAVNEVSVRARVKDVCRLRSCVDTLVLYLTGPARSNGALLFWDENNDGLIESKEEYSFHDIMADLRKCTARRVFLVADYSYSGNLVHKFPGKRPSRKTVIFTSTSQHEYSWRSDFTEAFVHSSRSNKVVSMREIFQVDIFELIEVYIHVVTK